MCFFCVCECVNVCVCVCTYICMYERMYILMYVHVAYVYIYVCVFVYVSKYRVTVSAPSFQPRHVCMFIWPRADIAGVELAVWTWLRCIWQGRTRLEQTRLGGHRCMRRTRQGLAWLRIMSGVEKAGVDMAGSEYGVWPTDCPHLDKMQISVASC